MSDLKDLPKTNKLQQFIQSIGLDKKDHNILGQITAFPTMFLALVVISILVSIRWGIISFNIVGIILFILYWLKEVDDSKIIGHTKNGEPITKGTKEFLDWWYTSLPVLQYLLLIDFLYLIILLTTNYKL